MCAFLFLPSQHRDISRRCVWTSHTQANPTYCKGTGIAENLGQTHRCFMYEGSWSVSHNFLIPQKRYFIWSRVAGTKISCLPLIFLSLSCGCVALGNIDSHGDKCSLHTSPDSPAVQIEATDSDLTYHSYLWSSCRFEESLQQPNVLQQSNSKCCSSLRYWGLRDTQWLG